MREKVGYNFSPQRWRGPPTFWGISSRTRPRTAMSWYPSALTMPYKGKACAVKKPVLGLLHHCTVMTSHSVTFRHIPSSLCICFG